MNPAPPTARARLSPKQRVAVAFDVETFDAAMRLRESLGDSLGLAKVGSALFVREGMNLVNALQESGVQVFLDLKFHDIPSVVGKAVEKAAAEAVDYLTVHAAGGRAMIEAAAAAAAKAHPRSAESRTKILAVTVLTSLSLEDWKSGASPTEPSIEDAVRRLARLAVSAGADGLVGSARETSILREAAGKAAILVTPGITTGTAAQSDQARTLSVQDAVRSGTDILVVGRGVWAASDPRAALNEILEELGAVTPAD
jgi:orotidine-5'-phosphate decarboxylase